jgi:hypothetical protein
MEFEYHVGLMIDVECNTHKSNHLRSLIRQATFSDSAVRFENVKYLPNRNLRREELLQLGSYNYVYQYYNIVFGCNRKR